MTCSDYLAQTGAGADPTDFRKNCQLVRRLREMTPTIGSAWHP